jgi:hypothetical protein
VLLSLLLCIVAQIKTFYNIAVFNKEVREEARMSSELRSIAINGMLGYGYPFESLAHGMREQPHILGVDAGSTDAGPFYLGHGVSLTAPRQIERDLRAAMLAAKQANIPLIVGSAGFGGARPHVDLFLAIADRIARAEGIRFRTAVIYADLDRAMVDAAIKAGHVRPLAGAPPLTAEDVHASSQLVGQMGTAPLIAALDAGAEFIVAGRACDTSIYAALPIMKGFDPGLAIHMAKIMECGAQCALPLAPNDCLLGTIGSESFTVKPLNPARTVTPESVAAHTLYEQPDPYLIHEPEGTVDMRDASFDQIDARTVRVAGSRLIKPAGRFTIKMEGARLVGYRAVTFAGIRDPHVIANIDTISRRSQEMAFSNLQGVDTSAITVNMRAYGRDAVLGSVEPDQRPPREIGLLIEAIALSQELANTVLALLRSSALHCPFEGRKTTAGNLAFPFSPSDLAAGPVYDFSVYHLLEVDDPVQLFPLQMVTLGGTA